MEPEEEARGTIDGKLRASGWQVRDYGDRDISLPGVAVREFPTLGGKEPVDYALFARGELVGIVEAKKAGSHLTAVERQSNRYCTNLRKGGGGTTRRSCTSPRGYRRAFATRGIRTTAPGMS